MGIAGVRAMKGQRSPAEAQAEFNKARGLGNQAHGSVIGGLFKRALEAQEREDKQRAAAAALSAAEKDAQEKTASLAASSGGGVSTNGYGTNTYIEGNPGQGDNQSQGDVDLSTSETTLRRRGGYRRDSGLRI